MLHFQVADFDAAREKMFQRSADGYAQVYVKGSSFVNEIARACSDGFGIHFGEGHLMM